VSVNITTLQGKGGEMTEPNNTEQLLAEMLKEMREQTKLLHRIDQASRFTAFTTAQQDVRSRPERADLEAWDWQKTSLSERTPYGCKE